MTTTKTSTGSTTGTSVANNKIEEKLKALLDVEAKKKNSRRLLLGVQTKDKRLDFRYAKTVANLGSNDDDGDSSDDEDNADNKNKMKKMKISPQDPYFIASQTKLFTATIIFQLVDEERVKLNDQISMYLPKETINKIHIYKGKDYSSEITIENLLHQTSGLADYFLEKPKGDNKKTNNSTSSLLDDLIAGKDTELTLTDCLNKARQLTPKFEPSAKSGKKSFYSDTNYQLLGAIIETITEMSISDNFESRIIRPLQLSNNTYAYDYNIEFSSSRPGEEDSSSSSNNNTKKRHHPMLFYYKDKELNIPKIMSSFGPDGGIVSTMDDMLVFLRAYFDGRLFDKAHHEQIQAQWNTVFVPPIQYGLGLMRFKVPKWMTLYCFDCPPLLGHSGSNASFAFYAPNEEVFMVGTFNQVDQESRPFPFMLQVLQCLK